jgi:hypothetical protein
MYIIPITSILGRLGLVPVRETATIPFSMRQETRDFTGASCDSKKGAGDGNRWWYINSWALSGPQSNKMLDDHGKKSKYSKCTKYAKYTLAS